MPELWKQLCCFHDQEGRGSPRSLLTLCCAEWCPCSKRCVFVILLPISWKPSVLSWLGSSEQCRWPSGLPTTAVTTDSVCAVMAPYTKVSHCFVIKVDTMGPWSPPERGYCLMSLDNHPPSLSPSWAVSRGLQGGSWTAVFGPAIQAFSILLVLPQAFQKGHSDL